MRERERYTQHLLRYWGFEATDPRDKAYSLLCLVANENQKSFPIDYSLTVNEIYINVARLIITTESNLDFVQKNELGSPFDELPIWVPDRKSDAANLTVMLK